MQEIQTALSAGNRCQSCTAKGDNNLGPVTLILPPNYSICQHEDVKDFTTFTNTPTCVRLIDKDLNHMSFSLMFTVNWPRTISVTRPEHFGSLPFTKKNESNICFHEIKPTSLRTFFFEGTSSYNDQPPFFFYKKIFFEHLVILKDF